MSKPIQATMNGADSLVQTLQASGIDTCFANPGTSEMHFVAALGKSNDMRCILGLTESVVTGAADGYGRMKRSPAVTLLHCGPGLANGLSNLHNARRAGTPIVNIVGDQASYHRPLDPPLAADTEGWARGVSAWTRTTQSAATIGRDAAVAVQAARIAPGQIATLIAPADTCWGAGGVIGEPLPIPKPPQIPAHRIKEAAQLLRSGEPVFILLGGPALSQAALADAGRIAQASGAKLMAQTFNGRVERGGGRFPITRLPYGVDQAIATLSGVKHLLLIGATAPVAPFAYPNKPGHLFPDNATVHVFARPGDDITAALACLADELSAPAVTIAEIPRLQPIVTGAISAEAVVQTLAALLPENAIIIDESVSFGRSFFNGMTQAPAHDWLQITGGAIGCGFPMATGAAIASPGRRVVSLQADGAGMFTVQALWTQAREALPITTVLLSNRKYEILIKELENVGAEPNKVALDMFELQRPDLNWVKLANGMGVAAAAATNMKEFSDLFAMANKGPGPFLIELIL